MIDSHNTASKSIISCRGSYAERGTQYVVDFKIPPKRKLAELVALAFATAPSLLLG